MRPWTEQWFADCREWYRDCKNNPLRGRYAHWCPDCVVVKSNGRWYRNLPIDETCLDFESCRCFRCICGELLEPKVYPFGRRPLEMFDDIFHCPKSRFWNFWRHDWYNLGFNDCPTRRVK